MKKKLETCQRQTLKNSQPRWVDTWVRDTVMRYWSADTLFCRRTGGRVDVRSRDYHKLLDGQVTNFFSLWTFMEFRWNNTKTLCTLHVPTCYYLGNYGESWAQMMESNVSNVNVINNNPSSSSLQNTEQSQSQWRLASPSATHNTDL